ncbi:MAG: hypothetical protein CENE_03303 [Candidatus Celerinatantimonas neptuna]|nr:MAG: hypothetical protein CENE_03303 [Candidatus Celerinatantimonas neptuna]
MANLCINLNRYHAMELAHFIQSQLDDYQNFLKRNPGHPRQQLVKDELTCWTQEKRALLDHFYERNGGDQ